MEFPTETFGTDTQYIIQANCVLGSDKLQYAVMFGHIYYAVYILTKEF